VKYALIDRHQKRWPIAVQCEVLNISASGYFGYRRRQHSDASIPTGKRLSDEALLVHIKAAHAVARGEYGWLRIWKSLFANGVHAGKRRIQRLMKYHGIRARGKRKYIVTTDSKHHLPITPNLLNRNF